MKSLSVTAASLLVFQNVLKGAVGEAFLAAVAAANKYQATNKEIVAAYGKFYSVLLAAGYESWQDYVLDQVLLGRDNAFARAVAQGGLEDGAPLLEAVAHDLDVLQSLCIPLSKLTSYITEVAPIVDATWQVAASSAALKPVRKQLKGANGTVLKANGRPLVH